MLFKFRRAVLTWARLIDETRVVPRLCLIGYSVLVYRVTTWAMGLPDISIGQTAFISTVVGIIPLIFNFYMQNKRDWSKDDVSIPSTVPGP